MSDSHSTHPGTHLRVDGLSFSFPDRRVLTNISFSIPSGDKVGLIGENGSGKSTLLRILAGQLPADRGTVTVNTRIGSDSMIGLLHQEPPFAPTETIHEAVERAVARTRLATAAVAELGVALAEEPENTTISSAFTQALEHAEFLEAWDIDARIESTVAGLGLASIEKDRLTSELSGGQRARLALAWLLLNEPDLLLLDEPTNHLDDAGVSFLTKTLRSWRGPVLMASHDRAFLDHAATSLIDLDPSPFPHHFSEPLSQDDVGSGIGITRFTGTYSEYRAASKETKLRWERQYRDEQAQLARLRATVRDQQVVGHSNWKPRTEVRGAQKFYSDRNAKVVSRRVSDARSRLELLEARQLRKPPADLQFTGLGTTHSFDERTEINGPVLVASGISREHRLKPTDFTLKSGEKWLITGPNGSGKSTLLEILSGILHPTTGQVVTTPDIRVKLLSQETVLPDPHARGSTRTVLHTYTDLVGSSRAEQVPLTTFGLVAQRDLDRAVDTLSVGQLRRLALAILLADPPEILLLDEPTNHLSLSVVGALEESLVDYPGAVVVASHDKWLRERWVGFEYRL